MAVVLEFAGQPRVFDLRLGQLIDLEEACGKVGIGVIFQRFATTSFHVLEVKHVLRLGLIGGGMGAANAEVLVREQFDNKPLMELSAIATDVLINIMTGVEPDELSKSDSPEKPFDKGAIFHGFVQAGIPPDTVRQMSYSDFVAIMRQAGGKNVQPPSEAEFNEMLARWRDRQE